jgi:hypothetical protein
MFIKLVVDIEIAKSKHWDNLSHLCGFAQSYITTLRVYKYDKEIPHW